MSVSQPSNITVIPASTKTGHATVEALLADPRKPKVTGYYRDLSRVPEALSANPNFVAVKGDIVDGSTLSFQGADAVLAVTPPRVQGHDDLVEFAKTTSENIKGAVLNSKSVKRLAYLSSIGAECEKGTGELMINHIAESILRDASFETVVMRPGFFMENWASSVKEAKARHVIRSLIPLDWPIPMVSISDIGKECKEVLLKHLDGADQHGAPLVLELHGPCSYTGADVGQAFTEVAGEKVTIETLPAEKMPQVFAQMKVPEKFIPDYVEMTMSFLPGGAAVTGLPDVDESNVRRGGRKLVDVVRHAWELAGQA